MRLAAEYDQLIGTHSMGEFTDASRLTDIGLVSLSVYRIIAALEPEPGVEIDAERLAHVHTVGELKRFLDELTRAGTR